MGQIRISMLSIIITYGNVLYFTPFSIFIDYCVQLENGLYYDPWNPWCGYIECDGGVARRVCCKAGTWLGLMKPIRITQKDLCRKTLRLKISNEKCPIPTTLNMCKTAEKVEKMNPKVLRY